MSKINLEIIEYIQKSDYEDKMKNFFVNAIIYEAKNRKKHNYSASYESMIENALEDK